MPRVITSNSSADAALVDRALPVIDTVVTRRCRQWKMTNDLREDVRAEVLMRLVKRLRDEESAPIRGFEDYVAAITSRAIDDMIRAVSPEWARLKQRIRYVLNHDDRFRVAVFPDGRTVCSLQSASIPGHRRVRTREAVKLARAILDELRLDPRERTIDALVSAVAERMGIVDPMFVSGERSVAARTPDAASVVETANYLERLWLEILDLPRRQRLALLLNARDAAGDSVLRLLVAQGTATPGSLAAALEITPDELERLWNGLPLKDSVIAERLDVTRQQVINLRDAARDRLARRMARTR